ncbi:hypothetical protein D3C71_376710 [compost metagenome]
MMDADISAEIARETKRREAVAEAARVAASEVGALNGPDKDFCELTYILGAMQEANLAFEARA